MTNIVMLPKGISQYTQMNIHVISICTLHLLLLVEVGEVMTEVTHFDTACRGQQSEERKAFQKKKTKCNMITVCCSQSHGYRGE